MRNSRTCLPQALVAGFALLVSAAVAARAEESIAPVPAGPNPAIALAPLDVRKAVIELPTERMLRARTAPSPVPPPAVAAVNPKVEPGKVRWHTSFAAACEASEKSGKPVLLFQLMGKLDEQFC